MFTADLYYIPKIACVFSEPYKNNFNWSMHTVKLIWRKKIFLDFWKRNI